jgi:hypothetical protein
LLKFQERNNLLPRGGRGVAGFLPLQIEVSQIMIRKAGEPNPLVGLFDTDGLAREHLAEINRSGRDTAF